MALRGEAVLRVMDLALEQAKRELDAVPLPTGPMPRLDPKSLGSLVAVIAELRRAINDLDDQRAEEERGFVDWSQRALLAARDNRPDLVRQAEWRRDEHARIATELATEIVPLHYAADQLERWLAGGTEL